MERKPANNRSCKAEVVNAKDLLSNLSGFETEADFYQGWSNLVICHRERKRESWRELCRRLGASAVIASLTFNEVELSEPVDLPHSFPLQGC